MLLYTDLATGSVLSPKICDFIAISSDKYLQGWSELTLVPKDVNLRKILTSKVKITRVN